MENFEIEDVNNVRGSHSLSRTSGFWSTFTPKSNFWRGTTSKRIQFTIMLVGLTTLFSFGLLSLQRPRFTQRWSWFGDDYGSSVPEHDHLPGFEDVPFERNWAMYTPVWPLEEYVKPPEGCEVTMVNILQRHGARLPTKGAAKRIRKAIRKLKHGGPVQADLHASLGFLKDYEYDLPIAQLVQSGAEQLYNSGVETYRRYPALVDSSPEALPFIRASLSERVILSATNWSYGFSQAALRTQNSPVSVIMPEDPSFNNTLDHNNCPAEGTSKKQTSQWISIFAPPIASRLAPKANLNGQDVYALLSLCPFETAALGRRKGLGYGGEELSPWCAVFGRTDFEMFEYVGDLDKFYFTGPGSKLGRVQGVGYVNELIARLTSQPVVDTTTTNKTLTASEETFPLNRTIYADFTHDNQMIAIYNALGLLDDYATPDPSGPQETVVTTKKRWRTSELVPFAAKMVVEKLRCHQDMFVRVLVNDKVQSLQSCGADGQGLCEMGKFVESQGYSTRGGDGDFEKCFVK